VMHIIHTGIPPILKSLFEDISSTKECLQDLSVLAKSQAWWSPRNWSLSSLTETLTCKELEKSKKIRLGNWQTNILSQAQLQYAATDAYVSWYLYQVLRSFSNTKAETNSSENMNNAES
ncbi:Werner Syndrome-like exonuclease, partial [Dioscorea cayenensis subsp. rotundata]|uniref:3'-5' exonuclease n=1 Tax=Dioscorea cayennensis subsp. rotundata TaxID=55577 RepID=A0AB40AXP4_DIOCR